MRTSQCCLCWRGISGNGSFQNWERGWVMLYVRVNIKRLKVHTTSWIEIHKL